MASMAIGVLLALGGCVEMTGDDGSPDEGTLNQGLACTNCTLQHNGCEFNDTLSQCLARHPTANLTDICAFESRSNNPSASSITFMFAPPSTGPGNNWVETWYYRAPTAGYAAAAQLGYPSKTLPAISGYPINTWSMTMQAYCDTSPSNAIILGTPYVAQAQQTQQVQQAQQVDLSLVGPQGLPTVTPGDAATCATLGAGFTWASQGGTATSPYVATSFCVVASFATINNSESGVQNTPPSQ